MRKTVLRNRGKCFSKKELQKAIEVCFRQEDSASNLGDNGPWYRVASNLGYSTKRSAIYALKKWCERNSLNFQKRSDKVEEETHTQSEENAESQKEQGLCNTMGRKDKSKIISTDLAPHKEDATAIIETEKDMENCSTANESTGTSLVDNTSNRSDNEEVKDIPSPLHITDSKHQGGAYEVNNTEKEEQNILVEGNNGKVEVKKYTSNEKIKKDTNELVAENKNEVLITDHEEESHLRKHKDQTKNGKCNAQQTVQLTDEKYIIDEGGTNISLSSSTIETTLGQPFPDQYFTAEIPTNASFYLTVSQWEEIQKDRKGRCLKSGCWEHIVAAGIGKTNPYCVYMFKWHRVSIARKRKLNTSPLFRGMCICKFEDCKNQCEFSMDESLCINLTFSSFVKHDCHQNHARPIKGTQRETVKEMFKYGQKPYKHYLTKFQETPNDVKIAGNFSNFGNKLGTFQKISSETKYPNKMDQAEFESLLLVAEKMKEDSVAKILPGFIRHIAILPPYLMYWTEAGVRIWHDMAKEGVGYFDATGTVVSPRGDGYKFYYYELACHNPIPGESIIPVSSMVSTLHSTPLIRFWLAEFRRSEKKIFGHPNASVPHQLTSDRSMALIQAGLSEFNNENLNGFRSRAWRILSGNGFNGDFEGMFPHACLAHVMSSFKKVTLEHYKSNFDFGMYCFSVVLNSADLTEASTMLRAVYHVLLSKVLDKKTLFHLEQIQLAVAKLPKDIISLHDSEDLEVYQENHIQLLFTETLNPNQYTEEDFQNRSTNNDFSTWSEKILKDVNVEIKKAFFVEVTGNNLQSKTLADKLHKLYIPTIALWSNMLLGDLSRHGKTNPYIVAKKKWMVQRTNSRIEKRFQVLKEIALDGTTVSRLDELSAKLKDHITAVQDVAVLKIAKKGRKVTTSMRIGPSKQTMQENWDKKPPKDQVHQTLGKYQKPPKDPQVHKAFGKYQNPPLENKRKRQQENAAQKVTLRDKSEQEHQIKPGNTSEDFSYHGKGTARLKSFIRSGDRDIALEDKELNFLKSRLRGLQNLGNTCWFNACLVTLATTDIMQLALDKFCGDFNFCPRMTDVLRLMEKMQRYDADIFDYDIETCVIACKQNYGMVPLQQNDAEEYFGAVLHDLNDALGGDHMIKMKQIITCVNCGDVGNQEEEYSILQLPIPNVSNGCVQDLIDCFYEDEELEDALCEYCGTTKKYKKNIPITLPTTLVISIKRYHLNQFQRIVKNGTHINTDNPIHFHPEKSKAEEYTFRSAILHHGHSPHSGHYTSVIKVGNRFISVDDTTIKPNIPTKLNTEGYVLVYRSTTLQSVETRIPCLCLANSSCLDTLALIAENSNFMSPQKRNIIERLQAYEIVKVSDNNEDELVYLLRNVPTSGGKLFVGELLQYLLKQFPSEQRRIYGVGTIRVACCNNCDISTQIQAHEPMIGLALLLANEGVAIQTFCQNCQKSVEAKETITSVGNLLMIEINEEDKWTFNNNQIEITSSLNVIHSYESVIYKIIACYFPTNMNAIICAKGNLLFVEDSRVVQELPNTDIKQYIKGKTVIIYCDKEKTIPTEQVNKHENKSFFQMFLLENIEQTFSPVLSPREFDKLTMFPGEVEFKGLKLDKHEMKRFLNGWLTDKHIDIYVASIMEQYQRKDIKVLPAAWFKEKISLHHTMEQYDKVMEKSCLLIPVNIDDQHWVLLSILPTEKRIVYMDPLGNFDKKVFQNVKKYLQMYVYMTTQSKLKEDEWQLHIPSKSCIPLQPVGSSCGVYVCLYIRQIITQTELHFDFWKEEMTLRQYMFWEILEFGYFNQKQEFGIKEAMLSNELDIFVHEMLSADTNSVGPQFERHQQFLDDPLVFSTKMFVNFGGEYFSPDTVAHLQKYLHDKYFGMRRKDPSKIFSLTCSYVKKHESAVLNTVLLENMTYGSAYIRDVLVKEVMIKLLSTSLCIEYEEANGLCKETEVSAIEFKRQNKKN